MKRGFTLVELMVVLAIIAILAAVAIPSLLRSRMNANHVAAKAACGTVMTEISTARTHLGHMPFLDELADSVDGEVYGAMGDMDNVSGTADITRNYKSYVFCYYHSTSAVGSASDTTRGVEAAPVKYDQSGQYKYYRTNESGVLYSVDAATMEPGIVKGDFVTFTDFMKTESTLSLTWYIDG